MKLGVNPMYSYWGNNKNYLGCFKFKIHQFLLLLLVILSTNSHAIDSTGYPVSTNYLHNTFKVLGLPNSWSYDSGRLSYIWYNGSAPTAGNPRSMGGNVTVPYSGYYYVYTDVVWVSGGPNFPIYLWLDQYASALDFRTNNSRDIRILYTGDVGIQIQHAWGAGPDDNFQLSGGVYLTAGSQIALPRVWTTPNNVNQVSIYTQTYISFMIPMY
jgi:hypothetical protein